MPTTLYETLFALDNTKVSVDPEAAKNQLNHLIEKYGGEIVVARPWDENGKLAYPIQKQKKAYFYILYYKLDSLKQGELEVDFKISENILRYITSRLDPKISDIMLDIAKNDHGIRFAYKAMKDEGQPTGEGIVSNDPLSRRAVVEMPPGELNADVPPPAPRRRRSEAAEKPE
jgi:small subunit ribosomal protein S6